MISHILRCRQTRGWEFCLRAERMERWANQRASERTNKRAAAIITITWKSNKENKIGSGWLSANHIKFSFSRAIQFDGISPCPFHSFRIQCHLMVCVLELRVSRSSKNTSLLNTFCSFDFRYFVFQSTDKNVWQKNLMENLVRNSQAFG